MHLAKSARPLNEGSSGSSPAPSCPEDTARRTDSWAGALSSTHVRAGSLSQDPFRLPRSVRSTDVPRRSTCKWLAETLGAFRRAKTMVGVGDAPGPAPATPAGEHDGSCFGSRPTSSDASDSISTDSVLPPAVWISTRTLIAPSPDSRTGNAIVKLPPRTARAIWTFPACHASVALNEQAAHVVDTCSGHGFDRTPRSGSESAITSGANFECSRGCAHGTFLAIVCDRTPSDDQGIANTNCFWRGAGIECRLSRGGSQQTEGRPNRAIRGCRSPRRTNCCFFFEQL